MKFSFDSLNTADETRLDDILSRPQEDVQTIIVDLLRYGVERLGVENGHLTEINVGLGTHTIVATSGSHPLLSEGETSDLSTTYCRKVLASGDLCVIRDAPNEGLAHDPAYEAYGFATYLGTKVVVDDQLYGTVCFVDADSREKPFDEADRALVEAIADAIGLILERSDATPEPRDLVNGHSDLLRRVQSVAQIGGWELDLKTNEIAITEELYRIFEIPTDESLTLDRFLQFYDADGRSRLQTDLKKCREEGTPFTVELPITTTQGNRRWVRTKGQPFYENGEMTRIVGVDQDITQQRELEEQLNLNRNRLRKLLSQSKPVVFILDADGTILLSEGEDLQSIGLSPGEVVGESVFDLYAGEPEMLGYVEQALSGESVDCEVEVEGVVFDAWFAPYYDDQGEVAGCIGVAADVTDRRRLEDTLERSRARLKALFEQNPVMIAVHDEDGTILDLNPRLCEETGYDEDELLDMKVWDLNHTLEPAEARALWDEMNAGDQKQLETTYRRRDGSTFPVELHLRHLDLGGTPQFLAIGRNVTDRKKEERRRKQIISRVTDAIVEVDADWQFTLVNEQAEELYDMDESDLLGRSFWDVFSDALGTRLEREYRRVMQTREPTTLTEYYLGLDGWFDIQVYPNDDGGVAFYFEDVTDQKERERRLEAVFNHTYQFTGLLTPDGTVLEVNDTALRFGGVEEADVIGKPIWDTPWAQTGEASKQRLRDAVARAAAGEFVRYERTMMGQDGERVVDFSIRPVTNDQGDVTLLIPEGHDITERKQQEEALREERNLLERIFQTSPTAITVLDAEGQLVRVSDRAREILGLETENVTDRTFNDPEWQITAPDGGPFPEEKLPFVRVKTTGESVYDVEHAIEWPDGTRRLLSVSGAPLHDADGTFAGAVFHLDDITERRQAQQRLRESEQRFRGVFENAGLGIALCNEDGTVAESNPAFEQMLGYDPGHLRGIHFEEITHPDDLDTDRRLAEELVAGTRDQYQIDKRYLRRDGSSFWGRLTVSRQEGPAGVQIVALVENIDEEKRSKEELRKFKQVVEQAYDAVLITEGRPVSEPGPRITYVNPAFTEKTGYDPEEVLGKTPRILQGPDTEPWVLLRLREQLEKGRSFEGEAINYKKDGTPYVNHWSIVPLYDEDDNLTHWVSVQRDVTERRESDRRLIEVQDMERRRIDQEMHDKLGGLLTSLQMTVDLARLDTEGEPVLDHLDDIEGLIDEVSVATRSISSRLFPSVLDEYGLFRALPSLIGKIESQHDLEIDLHNEVTPEERYSSLVETTAYRVVQEALWNVAQHAETDEAQVVVLTGERQLHVHVFDDGIGFDPSPPYHDEEYGLEALRRRVERLNGSFEVSSTPNEGTRASAMLPLNVSVLDR